MTRTGSQGLPLRVVDRPLSAQAEVPLQHAGPDRLVFLVERHVTAPVRACGGCRALASGPSLQMDDLGAGKEPDPFAQAP